MQTDCMKIGMVIENFEKVVFEIRNMNTLLYVFSIPEERIEMITRIPTQKEVMPE